MKLSPMFQPMQVTSTMYLFGRIFHIIGEVMLIIDSVQSLVLYGLHFLTHILYAMIKDKVIEVVAV